jgi:aminoglycoside 6'-N-acetyltransferase I
MEIVELRVDDTAAIEQTAAILVAGFRTQAPTAWPDLDAAREEVRASCAEGRLSLIARDDAGAVLGWIGGEAQYDGHVWELHPLVVDPARQGRGIGRALVAALETRVRERGGLTLLLGTDDEVDQTSLSGIELYPEPLAHLAAIRNLRRHPFGFYQRLGFTIVGVIPDANGFGKPDILMAKSLRRQPAANKSPILSTLEEEER